MLKKIFKKIEKALSVRQKLAVGLAVLAAIVVATQSLLPEETDIAATTVMITTMSERSGGSGVVVSNYENESEILTNRHVCEVVQNGGKVIFTNGERHLIKSLKKDSDHDLCIIVVPTKAKNKASIASTRPLFYEEATISGHPSLLPNVVTKGHFSGTQLIEVFVGIRECTKEEESAAYDMCAFFGGMPVIETYESVLVTATIMAGSSGSGVYNSNGELAALAFAGTRGLSYAYVVPYEFVITFVSQNTKGKNRATFTSPNYAQSLYVRESSSNSKKRKNQIIRKCEVEEVPKSVQTICDKIINSAEN